MQCGGEGERSQGCFPGNPESSRGGRGERHPSLLGDSRSLSVNPKPQRDSPQTDMDGNLRISHNITSPPPCPPTNQAIPRRSGSSSPASRPDSTPNILQNLAFSFPLDSSFCPPALSNLHLLGVLRTSGKPALPRVCPPARLWGGLWKWFRQQSFCPLSTCCVPGPELNDFQRSISSQPQNNPCFSKEETEAWIGGATWPGHTARLVQRQQAPPPPL